MISGTPLQPNQEAEFTVQVQDSNNPAQAATATFTLTVLVSLGITTTTLPTGTVGTPYIASITAAGGTPPYSFAISGGSLPRGLSMSRSGQITGTPAGAPAISTFTVDVVDSSVPVQKAQAQLSITVTGPLQITTTSLPYAEYGKEYSYRVTAAGGTPPDKFDGSILSGLSIDNYGIISGIALAPPDLY